MSTLYISKYWLCMGVPIKESSDNLLPTSKGIPLDTENGFDDLFISRIAQMNPGACSKATQGLFNLINNLKPGENHIIWSDPDTGLTIYIRRPNIA